VVETVYVNDNVSIDKAVYPFAATTYATGTGTGEQWATIDGYANSYIVSDQGRVRSLPRTVKSNGGGSYEIPGKELKSRMHSGGQLIVGLSRDGKSRMMTLRQLVAKAFVDGGPTDQGRMQVIHIDGNALNCNANNLQWAAAVARQRKK